MPAKSTRRTFLKLSAAAASVGAARLAHAAPSSTQVSIITKEPGISESEPVHWAIGKLKEALTARGILASNPSVEYGVTTHIIAVMQAEAAWKDFGVRVPTQPETVALVPWWLNNSLPYIVVASVDVRGLVYGLLELADRVRLGDDL